MKPMRLILPLGIVLLAGCTAANLPYQTRNIPEDIEWNRDSLDVYPNDVRQDPQRYADTGVAWAGVIKSSQASEFGDGMLKIHSVIEHHYFDWEQDDLGLGAKRFGLSPRGEGLFETDWIARKVDPDAGASNAEAFAKPGKMVIVYGVPKKVDGDGVVQLRYRYMRVIDKDKYATDVFDYGRFGEPVVYLR